MIYFLHGADFKRARQKLHTLTESLLKKKPDASVFNLNSGNWSEAQFEEFITGQGLFENKYIVIADKLLEIPEIKAVILPKLSHLKDSPNIFIFIEGEVDSKTLSGIGKSSEQLQEFTPKEIPLKKDFNVFLLTDAFGAKDRKNLWMFYRKAIESGSLSEDIHRIFFWQLKNIIIAKNAKSADEAGQKPFVFGKASRFAQNFTNDELKKKSSVLVEMYHNARRGITELDIALEKFILQV